VLKIGGRLYGHPGLNRAAGEMGFRLVARRGGWYEWEKPDTWPRWFNN